MPFAIAAWVAMLAGGFGLLVRHETRPGQAASTPSDWPSQAEIAVDPERPTILLFAHPQCPCTRATIGELDRIAARCGDRARIVVWIYSDPERDETWTRGELWASAERIPGALVRADIGGAEARVFGASTSGQAFLLATDGRLVFEGGITASRGHAGDNAGADAIVAWVNGSEAERAVTPVFGCGLRTPAPCANGSTP